MSRGAFEDYLIFRGISSGYLMGDAEIGAAVAAFCALEMAAPALIVYYVMIELLRHGFSREEVEHPDRLPQNGRKLVADTLERGKEPGGLEQIKQECTAYVRGNIQSEHLTYDDLLREANSANQHHQERMDIKKLQQEENELAGKKPPVIKPPVIKPPVLKPVEHKDKIL